MPDSGFQNQFKAILAFMFQTQSKEDGFLVFDPQGHLSENPQSDSTILKSLNAAFLLALAGEAHPGSGRGRSFLEDLAADPRWGEIVHFYLDSIRHIQTEVSDVCRQHPPLAKRLEALSHWVSTHPQSQTPQQTAEPLWSFFFPEAVGIRGHEEQRIKDLRRRRSVTVEHLNPHPLKDMARQLVFTSNVILTTPAESTDLDSLPYPQEMIAQIKKTRQEQQHYYYDHPIQIGVAPQNNEVLYGLHALDEAMHFERQRGNLAEGERITCLLSLSVTHNGLHGLGHHYLQHEIRRSEGFKYLDLYIFSEDDTQRMIEDVMAPAAAHYLERDDAHEILEVLGVDGEYGRHYSFLKAVTAFWQVLIQPQIRGTFKIDLDQVFPQTNLVAESGASALEHFMSPLWGAQGRDASGEPLDLSMIAGALVNESDIHKSLFTPDVDFPDRPLAPDEFIFFSTLPQALSTRAEMMARYDDAPLDGEQTCLQRIHVTGGTDGILIEGLRKQRPFTPSFIGRAEDQAYLLSVLGEEGARLAYVHAPGLIMRHDKEAFAQAAIQAAHIGKLVGDYVRLLYFSAYAGTLPKPLEETKQIMDPFTGGFISYLPRTVALLRFALKAAGFFQRGEAANGQEFIRIGAARIGKALKFMQEPGSPLAERCHHERAGWHLYYDLLDLLEEKLKEGDPFAQELHQRAEKLVADTQLV